MEITETFYARNRKEWREWLNTYHHEKKEVWLIYYKKHTGKPRVPYDDAVEEALCFGWIDSTVKKMDADRYCQRYSPRNPKSKWSELNIFRANKLIKEGLMMPAGKVLFDNAILWEQRADRPDTKSIKITPEFEQAIFSNQQAADFWSTLPKSEKQKFIVWTTMAKRADTREKRIKEAIFLLENQKRLGMK